MDGYEGFFFWSKKRISKLGGATTKGWGRKAAGGEAMGSRWGLGEGNEGGFGSQKRGVFENPLGPRREGDEEMGKNQNYGVDMGSVWGSYGVGVTKG